MMEEAVASYYDKQENGHASRIIQHQIKLAEIMNDKWDILTASIIQVIKKNILIQVLFLVYGFVFS